MLIWYQHFLLGVATAPTAVPSRHHGFGFCSFLLLRRRVPCRRLAYLCNARPQWCMAISRATWIPLNLAVTLLLVTTHVGGLVVADRTPQQQATPAREDAIVVDRFTILLLPARQFGDLDHE